MQQPLLEIKNLNVGFDTERGSIRPVRDVSLSVYPGQTVALVGESGCGKSVTAMSILRLIPSPPGKVLGGEIHFAGRDLLKLSEKEMRSVRGKDIAMIFQEPMTSLNPVFTIGDQIAEAVKLHQKVGTREAYAIAGKALHDVGINDPERRVHEYPHQLSGGMRQRIMIAMALACRPKLLIADEPTTALDVTIQAQILELLRKLQRENGMSILLITHDLGVVAENADAVAVMYASRVVEYAKVEDLFDRPQHPYTEGLFRSVPRLGARTDRLATIPGTVPNPAKFPTGCKFHPRCPRTRQAAADVSAPLGAPQQAGAQVAGAQPVAAPAAASQAFGARFTGSQPVGAQVAALQPVGVQRAGPQPASVQVAGAQVVESPYEVAEVVAGTERFNVLRLCMATEPGLKEVEAAHWAACHLIDSYAQAPLSQPTLDHRREVVAETIEGDRLPDAAAVTGVGEGRASGVPNGEVK